MIRIVGLVTGSLILWTAIVERQPLPALLGSLLVLQAIFNTGRSQAYEHTRRAQRSVDELFSGRRIK